MNGRAWLWLGTLALLGSGCAEPRRPPSAAPRSASTPASPPGPATVATAVATPTAARSHARVSSLASVWYPSEHYLLVAEAARLLRQASAAPRLTGKPVALAVPHAGWLYSGAAAAAAFANLHPGDFARVVLVGPSHEAAFDGFSVADVARFRTPLGEIPLCAEAAKLRDGRLVRAVAEAGTSEHAIDVELPLLQQTLGSFCVVPIVAGTTTAATERALAHKLAPLADGRTLFVFSSDFIHYGPRFDYTPFGPSAVTAHDAIVALEDRAIAALTAKDAAGFRRVVQATGATICGRSVLGVMLELLPLVAPQARGELLAHYGSTELAGEADDNGVWYVSLGYASTGSSAPAGPKPKPLGAPPPPEICTASSPSLDPSLGQRLVRLARATLLTELAGTADLADALAALPPARELDRRQAAFVTLTERGALRGCIGQLEPEYPLAEAVVVAAAHAALDDPRFEPVTVDELSALSIEVTVLTAPQSIASWQDIALGRHGIVLEQGRQAALFLPQVPTEQGWSLEQTLEALASKAGLAPSAWQSPATRFSVFEGQRFAEPEPPRPAGAKPP